MRLPQMLAALVVLSVGAPSASPPPQPAASRLPAADLNLVLKAPITTWDEAIPLGNGLLGGLLWGEGTRLRISLDRGDLWDERPADGVEWDRFNYRTMRELIAAGKNDEFNRIFDKPYDGLHPTKLPAGRVEVTLPADLELTSFELNLATAEGRAHTANGAISGFFSAAERVALVRIPGPNAPSFEVKRPDSLAKLGYAAAEPGERDGARWFQQETAGGQRFCVFVASKRLPDATLLALTVTTSHDGADPVAVAERLTSAALTRGYDASLKPHLAWWSQFWSTSRVTIPNPLALRHYYLGRYFYGAASRKGAPPMPLQGVWTADAGGLPPWKGDYHNDLNTQTTYLAYQAAGHFEEGAAFLDLLWSLAPRFRLFAREFYDAPGAAVPGVMTLDGQPLGGWGQYSLSPTMSAWCAHLFYLHWRYTMDDTFLRTRAYPWSREVGTFLLSLLKPDANGVLILPLSTSPEIHDNSARAWLVPNSNFDIACLRMLFLGLQEMATAVAAPEEAAQWADAARRLGPLYTNEKGALKLDVESDLTESHRHLSNLMSIHPFNLITVDGGADARRIVDASLADWDRLGTKAWVGYTFSWMACLRARAGDAEGAWKNLDTYLRAFILRNGFHANGDQLKAGFSSFTYRPFTLEGNFLAAQAVHEMLLQTWSPRAGVADTEVIRLLPAVPAAWAEASFEDLRAEGGHRVSARRDGGRTTWFRIVAGRAGVVRIRDTFGAAKIQWSKAGAQKIGENFEITLKRGEVLEATMGGQ
jgi:alpha-L-fucosidase 2